MVSKRMPSPFHRFPSLVFYEKEQEDGSVTRPVPKKEPWSWWMLIYLAIVALVAFCLAYRLFDGTYY